MTTGFVIQFSAVLSDSLRMITMELLMRDMKLDTLSMLVSYIMIIYIYIYIYILFA